MILLLLGQGCGLLKTLHLQGLKQVTDDDLIALMQGCVMLHVLFLTGARAVSDVSLRYISGKVPL